MQVEPGVHEALRFTLRGEGAQAVLRISNPTPVHQTLVELVLGSGRDDPAAQVLPVPDMIAPGASVDVPLPAGHATGRDASEPVHYSVIDDHGIVVQGVQAIERELAAPSDLLPGQREPGSQAP